MVTGLPNTVLTEGERDILSLADRGLTNQDIANEFGISTQTVESVLHRVYIKLGARNRAQAFIDTISRMAIAIEGVRMVTELPNAVLTERERGILSLVGRGLTNQDIANELSIPPRTVKSVLHRVCIKLGARNRTQAVLKAISGGAMGIQEITSPEELAAMLESLGPEVLDTVVQRLNSKYEPRKIPAVSSSSLKIQKACELKRRKY